MKKETIKSALIIGILLILALLSFLFDNQIIKFVESQRSSFFDNIFLGFTLGSSMFIIFFFLTALFLWEENKKRWIIPLLLSGILSSIISFLIKIVIHRQRPFETGTVSVLVILFDFMKNSFNVWDFSFPSMHAMIVFSAVPILDKEFKKFKYIWILFAVLAAFSRVYFGVHYLSDVLFGAALGYLIGYIMVLIEEKYQFGKKIFRYLLK
ncbi:Undecaprenyl-diphosphatase [uncultured archaeon]|nr:Undecaprenyl-diphosphatase [uncultured archaeon]